MIERLVRSLLWEGWHMAFSMAFFTHESTQA